MDSAALRQLGFLKESQGDFDAALEAFASAVALTPDDVDAQFSFALYLRLTRQFGPAEAAYRRVLALDPGNADAALGLAAVLLVQRRFAEGFAVQEGRPMRRRLQALPLPEWDGGSLAGKRLLVWREQGYGDQIVMARFLPALAEAGAQVTYAGPRALQRLFSRLPVTFIEDDPRIDLSGFDAWVLPMSLPHRLGLTEPDLSVGPYLSGQAGTRGGIGVIWRGEPKNMNDRFRSLPRAQAERLLALPGAISLEPSDTGAIDFQASADVIAGLDLVITVDTSVAHLAGAMGAPVWVTQGRYGFDWYWPLERASPWHPHARVFIQATPGDWDPVVDAICREAAAIS